MEPRDEHVARLEKEIRRLEADLDKTRRLNRDLRSSEEQTRLIIESAVEYAIFTMDELGVVTTWNDGARRLLGYSEDEILGRDGRIVFTPDDRARGAADWEIEQALNHGRVSNERWHMRKDGSIFWGSGTVMALRQGGGVLKIMRDDTQRRHADEQRRILIAELNHRVKNTLASVQSIVSQTLRASHDLKAFNEAVRSRIFALARAHDLLTRETWTGATIGDVVRAALDPWLESAQIQIRGPHVRLSPSQSLALSMALHELATNAVKYGSLSVPEGQVETEWQFADELILTWTERNGPPVTPPQRHGFGSRVLNRALAIELAGDVTVRFDPGGVVCSIRVPEPGT